MTAIFNPQQKDGMKRIRDMVEVIVKNLVNNPRAVDIHGREFENAYMIDINVDESDLGKVLGRQGKTIINIRSLCYAVAGRYAIRVIVEVKE